MARVVQRRSTPPYLLIIVFFLFLVATTLAVMQYMSADEANNSDAKSTKLIRNLASPSELQNSQIQDMIQKYNTSRSGEPLTVLTQFSNQVKELTKAITGQVDSYAVAMAKADAVFAGSTEQRGLAEEIRQARDRRDEKVDELKTAKDVLVERDKQIKAMGIQYETLAETHKIALASLQGKLTGLHNQLNAEQAQHRKLREAVQAEADKKDEGNKKARVQRNEMIQKLQMEIQAKNAKISDLEAEIKRIIGGGEGPEAEIRVNVAGEIMNEPSQEGVCFINAGKRDGIEPGFTFAIYPAGRIAKDAKSKGSLHVTSVGEGVSQCRITKRDRSLTVLKGDQVANLIFDAKRSQTFVVEGEFDLHGTGKPSTAGAEEVRMLINRYGGKIVEEVGVDTDYVVLGAEMPKPPQPTADAPAPVRAAYRAQMEFFNRYSAVKSKALELRIRVLNTNRFLDHIGVAPAKRLEYK